MSSDRTGTKVSIDQMGRSVAFTFPPQRIISLVPSQTELLFDLELQDKLIGITKFCFHPISKVKSVEKVGGTKRFKFDKIGSLNPDLIIGNKEENYKEGIEYLDERYPVWMSDINNLQDALAMIKSVGEITNTKDRAVQIVEKIRESWESIPSPNYISAAYVIWKDPIMVAASNTFIDEMLIAAGFRNVFKSLSRYPIITPEQLIEAAPDYILLSSEPYPFKEIHLEEFTNILPSAKAVLVDGEMFSWYGSRLLKAPAYFSTLQANLLSSVS